MLYSKHLAEGALVARDPLCSIPVDSSWPAHIAGPTLVACSTVGVATRIFSRLPVQKLLPRPQGPEHPGHWRSGQARAGTAGMGLKLKEEAKKFKGRVN